MKVCFTVLSMLFLVHCITSNPGDNLEHEDNYEERKFRLRGHRSKHFKDKLTSYSNHSFDGKHRSHKVSLNLPAPSYFCSENETFFQYDNIDLVIPSICDTNTPWKLAHLVFPDANMFLDIGGNKGYTAAKIFNLWSPGHKLNGQTLFDAIESQQKADSSDKSNTDTVCGERMELAPFVCVGKNPVNAALTPAGSKTGFCGYRRSIDVISFEGQESHVNNQINLSKKYFSYLNTNYTQLANESSNQAKSSWEFIHAALTGPSLPEGVAHGYFDIQDDESGKLILLKGDNKEPPANSKPVKLLTVDQFCRERNIDHVDIIKIDAEGHDFNIIEGAYETLLKRHVKMLTLEAGEASTAYSLSVFAKLDKDLGFDCYINGEQDILVRVTNCWDPKYFNERKRPECDPAKNAPCPEFNKPPELRLDGNAYCVHRSRASTLNSLFQEMSLYKYSDGSRGDVIKDALLSTEDAYFEANKLIHPIEDPVTLNKFYRRTRRDVVTGARKWN